MKPNELRKSADGRERRFIPDATVGLITRAADGSDQEPRIEGYGALFNEETVIYGMFRERILPGAFKDSIANDDIRVAFNHSANAILGRTTAKTATVEEDSKGLRYTAVPPDTQAGRDTVTSIKRRDITGSSFQFEVENDADEEWDDSPRKQGKLPLRTIKRAKLWECGPVAWPAYESTTVSARAISGLEEARQAPAAPVETRDEASAPCEACQGTGKRRAAIEETVADESRTEVQAGPESYEAAQVAALDVLERRLRELDD
jgi:Escherichia/Staphylococcus phage prohead protease